VRTTWSEAVLELKVTVERSGAPPSTGSFEVAVKGDRSRVAFQAPEDKGKLFVSDGKDAWLVLPTAKNPIKVPRSHRLTGGFAAADVARTHFADDYDAVLERTEVLGGRECDVIRLAAKRGADPSYPVVRVWVDPKEGLYRKAVFLLASGRTAREVTFDAYKAYHGVLSLERMTILDTLRPGKTVVEYVDYVKKSLPDAAFDPKTARNAS
jgi:outer membrane lipoprotein-sorting protein